MSRGSRFLALALKRAAALSEIQNTQLDIVSENTDGTFSSLITYTNVIL